MSRAPVEIERALETADGDVELLRDVVTLFLTEWTSQFTALERALEKRDTAGVESGACRLQMMLENVGALEAAQLAQTLRSLGEEGRFHEGMSVLRALWEQIARVVSFYTHPDWEMEAIRIAKR